METPKTWQFFMRFDAYWDGSTRQCDTLQLSMIRAAGVLAMLPDVPPDDVATSAIANTMIPVLQVIGQDGVEHGDLNQVVEIYEGQWQHGTPMLRDAIVLKYARNASKVHPNQTTICMLVEAIVDMCLLFGISRDAFETVLAEKARVLDGYVVGWLEG